MKVDRGGVQLTPRSDEGWYVPPEQGAPAHFVFSVVGGQAPGYLKGVAWVRLRCEPDTIYHAANWQAQRSDMDVRRCRGCSR